MGLFSFLKKAGANWLPKKEEKIEVSPEELNAQKAQALKDQLDNLGLCNEDFIINVNDDRVVVSGTVESQEMREKAILALGNVAGIAFVEDQITVTEPKPEATFYEVKKGDTLYAIAKDHYGNGMKYPVIFEANKPMLKSADLIYPGQVLRIPPLEA
jgi:nucleoid-associated protein YgaU